jgi:hypothetical protein
LVVTGRRTVSEAGRQPGPCPPLSPEEARELVIAAQARAAILVEGWSDQAALEALARRRGIDLPAEGIVVVPMGGATNTHRFGEALGPLGLGLRLAGLCDAAEAPHVLHALRRAGIVAGAATTTPGDDAFCGLHVCQPDLEDELIRALGAERVLRVLEADEELTPFRRFQAQPAQRGRELHAQLHRFLGIRAGRKVRYGALLVEALDVARVPRALDGALASVRLGVCAGQVDSLSPPAERGSG